MAGANLAFTPALTGKVRVTLVGGMRAGSSTGGPSNAGVRYATTAFTVGAAAPSTAVVGKDQSIWMASSGAATPFTLTGVVTGLTVSPATTYYFDLAYDIASGSIAASPVNLYAIIEETP
jgi:hypothetical protein